MSLNSLYSWIFNFNNIIDTFTNLIISNTWRQDDIKSNLYNINVIQKFWAIRFFYWSKFYFVCNITHFKFLSWKCQDLYLCFPFRVIFVWFCNEIFLACLRPWDLITFNFLTWNIKCPQRPFFEANIFIKVKMHQICECLSYSCFTHISIICILLR